jgi:hypothetical protein
VAARRRSTVAVSLEEKRAERLSAAVPAGQEALFGVALLKLALEIKKPGAPPLEALVPGVVRRMGLDEAAFQAWLLANGGLLRGAAGRRG